MNIHIKYVIGALLLAGPIGIRAQEANSYTIESTATSEVFQTRVLKVHHFIESGFEYLAYTVDWRGQEVVVFPSSTKEILKEGDIIRCTMRSKPMMVGEDQRAAITFSVLSPEISVSDTARLQTIATEVGRRRAMREEAVKSSKR